MNKERAKELLETELKCITRIDTCNRDCGKCDLVQDKGYVQMGNKKISHIQRDSRKTRKEVTMTNMVDFLRELRLNNKKLAELLEESRICNCTKGVTNWSETERKLKKEINEQKMNVFISQLMGGLTNDEIKQRRLELLNMIQERYPTEKIHLIDSLIENPPHDCNSSVWCLGKSLEYLAQTDLAFFSKDWECARGCFFEHSICLCYNIPIAYEDECFTHESVYYHYDADKSPLSSYVKGDK